jgi:K+-sensing histidine kinase KdpD
MKKTNVMVCVTQQKTCDRLINYGYTLLGNQTGELYILHVAHYNLKFLGNENNSDALEYLYEKARDYGANLTVVRSDDVLETLVKLAEKNKISYIILGASNEIDPKLDMAEQLKARMKENVTVVSLPAL